MIAADAVSVALGGRTVLHGATLHVPGGSMVALCGPNGAGKTTLLRALAGIVAPASGRVTRPPPARLAYVAQNAGCAWALTVAQVVALGRLPHQDADAAAIEEALYRFDLLPLRDARIDRVSGGQARRALLARAFATRPDAMLLDEPVADLDPLWQHRVLAVLRRAADSGMAVVVVLHAVELAAQVADRMVLMQHGRVVADLPAADALPGAARVFGMALGQGPRLVPPA